MRNSVYTTKESILKRAQEIIGILFKDIDKNNRLASGKGGIGVMIEENWFDYHANSDSEPDFPEAGVELKVTPYIKNNKNAIRAKERLVCNIINYMEEYRNSFETSSFWHKCKLMLIMSYEYKKDVPKSEFTVDKVVLFSFPEEDLAIIKQDWEKIISKIRNGEAHLLTEGDTLYLAACTKGESSASVRQQPFSEILAKQRAYSLKGSYMTYLLNTYIFGIKEDVHIVKDWHDLERKSFEDYVLDKLSIYRGKTQDELKKIFDINSSSKNINELLVARMLGIKGKVSSTKEFKNAHILPKTIRVLRNGTIKESMSFRTFKFKEIIEENWEDSKLRNELEPTKFLFVVFRENDKSEYFFDKAFFWNIPYEDLEEVKKVWEKTIKVIKDGVELYQDGRVTKNNLPKSIENRVAHVRPHAQDSSDTYQLPDGRFMPKQCFWFNASYVKKIIEANCGNKISVYRTNEVDTLKMAAEEGTSYGNSES